MEKKFLQNCTKSFLRMIVVCAMLFHGTDQLRGEGTNPLSPTANDSVFLAVVNATMFPQQSFYQFASYDGPEYSRLNIKIVDHNIENIYIGLSPEVDGDGLLSGNTGNFWMRIKDPTGTVVHGPFLIDTTNANAKTFALANAGPDVVAGMSGYSTAAAFASFNPTMNGDYYVEISESMVAPAGGTINIQWFDFTVVDTVASTAMLGRLWTRNWSLRTPRTGAQQTPDCEWDREFNGAFYSYTEEGFVTEVQFNNSGFQGLNFQVAFGTSGPGGTGDLAVDRRSVKSFNLSVNSNEHKIFVNEPDIICYPSDIDVCGSAEILNVTCQNDSFCIKIIATDPGQVELVLDFSGNNGLFDNGTNDVILVGAATTSPDTVCLKWDGKKGDGSDVLPQENVPTLVRYTQGVQHYAMFDVEFLKNGFCVNTIRPLCPGLETNKLYWDDVNITDDIGTSIINEGVSGTGAPNVNLNGCTCQVGDTCRTYDNFVAISTDANGMDSLDCDGESTGYGEFNTMNTWWFAAIDVVGPFNLPLLIGAIAGDTSICEGDSTSFTVSFTPDTISTLTYAWTGPNGFMATMASTGMVADSGEYCVTVIDTASLCEAVICVTLGFNENVTSDVSFVCLGGNTLNADVDLTVLTGTGTPTFLWSNGATTEDLTDVPLGEYSVIITDSLGCMGFDTILVEGCCILDITCPDSIGGQFSCLDSVPAIDTSVVTINNFCDSVMITGSDVVSAGTGCIDDTITITRTYLAVDGQGNMDSCVQTFKVVDNLNPEIVMGTCPGNISVLCTEPTDTMALGAPSYTDNCSAVLLFVVDDSTGFDGTCNADVIGQITRTFFGTDGCGNIDSSCVQIISVLDTIAPMFTAPADAVIQCTDDSSPATTGEVLDTTDNCSAITLSFADVIVAGVCPALDTIQRTWTASDICGNETSIVQTITVVDTVAPVILTCPVDMTLDCNGSLDTAATGVPTYSDNCTATADITVTFADSNPGGTCSSDMPIVRTFTITDACGNSSTCVQNLVIDDSVPPVLDPQSCPMSVIVDCTVDISMLNIGTPTYTDNCTDLQLIVVTSQDDTTGFDGTCSSNIIGTITRTFYAADICGNIDSSCTVMITVEDFSAPTFTVPGDTILDCTSDTLVSTTGDVLDAMDGCSDVTVTMSDLVVGGECPAIDTTYRTWTVTDDCGNVSTGLQTITRVDTTGPVFTVPADLTIQCNTDSSAAVTGMVLDATDDCTGVNTIVSTDMIIAGTCPAVDTIRRIWVVEDFCENVTVGVQLIIRLDTEAPTFTVPADVEIDCAADASPSSTGDVIDADDACSAFVVTSSDSIVPGQCPALDTILRTWTATDACNNILSQIQRITRIDTTGPVFVMGSCPADITIDCAAALDTFGLPTYTDNCSAVTFTFSDDSTGFDPPSSEGQIMRTFIAMDACGNVDSSCVQVITVQDNTAPVFLTCPADLTVTCPPLADTALTGLPTYMDDCSALADITLSFSDDTIGLDGSCIEGVITRTFSIVDVAGNIDSSCVQIIAVIDTVGPVFDPPADITVDCDADLMDVTITGTVSNASDCSAIADTSFTDVVGMMGCDGTGTIIRTWTLTDACGNTGTAEQMILVQDTIQPNLTAPPDVTLSCEQNPADTSLTGSIININDNCSMAFMVSFTDDTTGLDQCNGTGVIIRTWFAGDECDNVGEVSQTITIVDNTPPTALCMDIDIDFGQANQVILTPDQVDAGSFDNCGDVVLSLSQNTFECLDFGDNASVTIQLIATDACGNTSSCDLQVTGSGGGGVIIDCPTNIVVQLGPGECEGIASYEVSASSECGDSEPVIEQVDDSGLTSGDAFPIGVTIQEYIATDGTGDTAMCSFTVTVLEYPGEFDPTCNDHINISLDENCEAIITPEIILEGEDFGCGNNFIIEVEGYDPGTGQVIIVNPITGVILSVSITDPESGLSCWGTITFEDKIPPTIECIDVTITCGADTEPVLTAPIVGTLTASASPGAAIGPDGGTVTSQTFDLSSPADAQVTDVNITVDLTHTFSSDLDVFLIGPDGTSVELATDLCGATDDWTNLTFDDQAVISVVDACNPNPPALTGPVQPEGLLSDFNGSNAGGVWTLEITDDAGGDAGVLISASIEVSYFVAQPYQPVAFDACGEVELTYEEDETGEDCTGFQIIRTWTATDQSGNTSTCIQTITIDPLDLNGLEYPPAYTGECGESITPDVTGYPTINGVEIGEQSCNLFTAYWDEPLGDCGGGAKIHRTWTVFDWCTQEVFEGMQVIKLTDEVGPVITCPDNIEVGTDFWYCYANVSLPQVNAYDECSGAATIISVTSTGGIIAQVGNNYVVNELPIGVHTITIVASDVCDNTSSCSYTITVSDEVPPVPSCDEHTVISLTTDGPQGLTLVDAAVFDDGSYDNCGPVTFRARRMDSCIDFDWTTQGAGIDDIPNGIVNGRDRGTIHRSKVPFSCCDAGTASGSSRMPIMVELEVTDASGNVNYCMVEVTVQDKIAPFLECPPNIIVSCDFWFDDDVPLNQFIPAGQDGLNPVFGTVLDAFDYNDDESARQPIIIDDPGDNNPQPVYWGLDGWADDNCHVFVDVRIRITDDCSGNEFPADAPANAVRRIERTFRARDVQGNSSNCVQVIYVVDYKPFGPSDITWPKDIPSPGCNLNDCPAGELTPDNLQAMGLSESCVRPRLNDDNCSLIGVTYKDTRFDFVEGACYKILREWSVIDWCQYDMNTGAGLWSHTQVIKVIDTNGPDFEDCPQAPVTLCVEDEEISLPENNQVFLGEENSLSKSCNVHLATSQVVTEHCSGYVIYDVKIYPFNGNDYYVLKGESQVTVDSSGQAILTVDTRTSPVQAIRENGLPYNSPYCGDYHRILWSVEDGCGNASTCEYLVRLEDCKKPSPVCINGLSSVVMPSNGMVTIWAKDFNASSVDDCTPSQDLLYSFSGDTYEPSFTYTCENVDAFDAELPVRIWVADGGVDHNCNGQISWNERNKDYCTTTIVISDNDDVCSGSGSLVSGEVLTHDDLEPVSLTTIHLKTGSAVTSSVVTEEDGQYSLYVPMGASARIEAERNDDHMNGVSTLDLVRIQKHLLGIAPFETPYQFIAADANNSEAVSAIDLVEIRKLILGIYLEYPNNKSWRFVQKGYEFQDAMHPWPFEEGINLTEVTESLSGNDFMAIKIGDVNNTAVANANEVEIRGGNAAFDLKIDDQKVSRGQNVRIPVFAADVTQLLGMQFTMETTGLQYVGIESGSISISDDNVGVFDQALTLSWNQISSSTVGGEEPLFTLIFESATVSDLKDLLTITNQITESEAYDQTENIMDISLRFDDGTNSSEEFALFQNEPNPFANRSIIGFILPQNADVDLKIHDAAGRIVREVNGDFAKGYNQIEISTGKGLETGVYYYTLTVEGYTATKKMLILK